MKMRCIIDTCGKVNTSRAMRVSVRKSRQKAARTRGDARDGTTYLQSRCRYPRANMHVSSMRGATRTYIYSRCMYVHVYGIFNFNNKFFGKFSELFSEKKPREKSAFLQVFHIQLNIPLGK